MLFFAKVLCKMKEVYCRFCTYIYVIKTTIFTKGSSEHVGILYAGYVRIITIPIRVILQTIGPRVTSWIRNVTNDRPLYPALPPPPAAPPPRAKPEFSSGSSCRVEYTLCTFNVRWIIIIVTLTKMCGGNVL